MPFMRHIQQQQQKENNYWFDIISFSMCTAYIQLVNIDFGYDKFWYKFRYDNINTHTQAVPNRISN